MVNLSIGMLMEATLNSHLELLLDICGGYTVFKMPESCKMKMTQSQKLDTGCDSFPVKRQTIHLGAWYSRKRLEQDVSAHETNYRLGNFWLTSIKVCCQKSINALPSVTECSWTVVQMCFVWWPTQDMKARIIIHLYEVKSLSTWLEVSGFVNMKSKFLHSTKKKNHLANAHSAILKVLLAQALPKSIHLSSLVEKYKKLMISSQKSSYSINK